MVTALLNLSDNANRVLNSIKARHELKDKSEAVEHLVNVYIEEKNDPELRPEFLEELKRAEKEKSIEIKGSLIEHYRIKDVQEKNKRKARKRTV